MCAYYNTNIKISVIMREMKDFNTKTPQNIASFNPDLKSVLGEIEEGHYLIIAADLKKAYLFLFNKGIVETSKNIMDPSVGKRTRKDSGEISGRSNKLSHRIDNQIHRHLQLIIQEAVMLIKGKHINGVFLGGHKPLFHSIVNELPADSKNKLRGEFITELNIPQDELINHCKHVLEEYIK